MKNQFHLYQINPTEECEKRNRLEKCLEIHEEGDGFFELERRRVSFIVGRKLESWWETGNWVSPG